MPKERLDRAKQFMPFDALKGFKEALNEKEIEVEKKVELSEDKQEKINEILSTLKPNDTVEAIYYENGKYRTIQVKIQKISFSNKKMILNDKVIYFNDIRDIRIVD